MNTTIALGRDLRQQAAGQEAALYRDGMVGLPGCFSAQWADELHADFVDAFAAARSHPRGTLARGPHRYYFAVHPERIRGFVDLVTHPRVVALCEQVLGPDYRIVELGFDVPLAGAMDQPWHRDFRTPPETAQHRRLSSLALNVTTVDVTPGLAPFEIALGTHFDDDSNFDDGIFPRLDQYPRLQQLAGRRYPKRGDVSARTGLALHRGTKNFTERARPVLIVGVVSADVAAAGSSLHHLSLTKRYAEGLPAEVLSHLRCTVDRRLKRIVQQHDVEGLMMGGEPE